MEKSGTQQKEATKEAAKIDNDEEMIIESSEDLEVVKSFDELGLREELLRGIYAYGFNKPSAV
jgi:ATP-dependent RNA helicase